jgi:hypothetical protein
MKRIFALVFLLSCLVSLLLCTARVIPWDWAWRAPVIVFLALAVVANVEALVRKKKPTPPFKLDDELLLKLRGARFIVGIADRRIEVGQMVRFDTVTKRLVPQETHPSYAEAFKETIVGSREPAQPVVGVKSLVCLRCGHAAHVGQCAVTPFFDGQQCPCTVVEAGVQ